MPTLTKNGIVNEISNKVGFKKKDSTDIIEKILEIIKRTLENGEDVLVSGFGKFCVKEKGQRKGRNPATGAPMMLKARRVVTFKCSGKLRENIERYGATITDLS